MCLPLFVAIVRIQKGVDHNGGANLHGSKCTASTTQWRASHRPPAFVDVANSYPSFRIGFSFLGCYKPSRFLPLQPTLPPTHITSAKENTVLFPMIAIYRDNFSAIGRAENLLADVKELEETYNELGGLVPNLPTDPDCAKERDHITQFANDKDRAEEIKL